MKYSPEGIVGSPCFRGTRATIKAHPASLHHPRPYGKGYFPRKDTGGEIKNDARFELEFLGFQA